MEHQLLFYSFQQIKGVSKIKESVYWDAGETLISLRDTQYAQQTFLTENDAGADIQQSIDAIQRKMLTFLKNALPINIIIESHTLSRKTSCFWILKRQG